MGAEDADLVGRRCERAAGSRRGVGGDDGTDEGAGPAGPRAEHVSEPCAGALPLEGGGAAIAVPPDVWGAYERMAGRMRRAAHRILRDGHEAEDVVHDAMIAAHLNAHRLRDPARLEPWLMRIARNLAASTTRSRRRCRPDTRVSTPPGNDTHEPPLRARSPLESVEPAAESVFALREALDRVPRDWREAFDARVKRGRPFEEIAESHGISVACVKTRISRVRTKLRESVEP